MIIALIIACIFLFTPIAIYLDATKHKIGQVGKKTFLNKSAGEIAAECGLFWPIGIPLYLWQRKKLIEKAKLHPVEVSFRRKVLSILLLLILIPLVLGWWQTMSKR